jgi:UDP-glucose 4-epimerase
MSQGQTWLLTDGAGYIGSHYFKSMLALLGCTITVEVWHEKIFGETTTLVVAYKGS